MPKLQVWSHLPGKAVLFFTDVIAATALIFEGELYIFLVNLKSETDPRQLHRL